MQMWIKISKLGRSRFGEIFINQSERIAVNYLLMMINENNEQIYVRFQSIGLIVQPLRQSKYKSNSTQPKINQNDFLSFVIIIRRNLRFFSRPHDFLVNLMFRSPKIPSF